MVGTDGESDLMDRVIATLEVTKVARKDAEVRVRQAQAAKKASADNLAQTRADLAAKEQEIGTVKTKDVIAVLRSGIDVMTTLNVQHFEGVGDAVERLTGTRVRDTLPDSVLEFADEVLFVDVTPDVLRQRLREAPDFELLMRKSI